MVIISHQQLRSVCSGIIQAAGSSPEEAKIVSDHLVEGNLLGVDSHGVQFLPGYIDRVLGKAKAEWGEHHILKVTPNAKLTVQKETPTTAHVDGGGGYGQVGAIKAMEVAISKAKTSGIGIVTAENFDHVGRVGAYPLMAAREDLIGIIFAKNNPVMAPLGGKVRSIGNDPIAFAMPSEEEPVLIDMAMSAVAGGKVILAKSKGESIPLGWALDPDGNPTTDPDGFMLGNERNPMGGVLLPMAAHKGYALGVIVEVLGGILSGMGALGAGKLTNSIFLMAISVDSFMPLSEFKSKTSQMARDLRNSPRAPGVNEIICPGDLEWRTRKKRSVEGIPLPDPTWEALVKTATSLNVEASLT